MLFIEIETDPYTATRLAGNDLEICKLTYGTRKELFQIRLRDIPDLLAVIINADGGISLVVVCIIGEIIELAVLLDFTENILTIAPYAVVVIECHADELKRNIVAICVEPLSALATAAGAAPPRGELSPKVTERVLQPYFPSPSSLRSATSPKGSGKGCRL